MGLLEQFTRGELAAFETLFRQHQGEVYRWIVRIVRNPALAEDLTIETFWRIYRAHARFDPARSFGAWARRIATNVAIDHLDTLRREVPLHDGLAAPNAGDAAMQAETREHIQRAFRQLPGQLQVIATLALIEEESYEAIATALEIPIGTVKSRMF